MGLLELTPQTLDLLLEPPDLYVLVEVTLLKHAVAYEDPMIALVGGIRERHCWQHAIVMITLLPPPSHSTISAALVVACCRCLCVAPACLI